MNRPGTRTGARVASALVVVGIGEGEVEKAHTPCAGGPELGIPRPREEALSERNQVTRQLRQLLGRQVQALVTERGRFLPLGLLAAPALEPVHEPLEIALGNDSLEEMRGRSEVRVVGDRRPVGDLRSRLPGALAPASAAGLLDEPVLGELAKVERAAGRALIDELGRLGCRERAAAAELTDQGETHGVGDRTQRARIGEVNGSLFGLLSHRKESFESILAK